ncbi:hypothetical protein ACFOFO_13615 [Undibacterium arcticum]|uniref:Carbohydrate porin n=1 Tax=Undibacterium arcticum TaxID=1762892 RepID=A0ABV7F3V7_9BURK
MNLQRTSLSASIVLMFAMTALPSYAQSSQELAQMRAEIKQLRDELNQLKNAKQAAPDAALADRVEQVELRSKDAVVLGDIPNSFRLPNSDTSLHIYGFAELNMVKEFKGDNSDQDYSTFHCRGLTLIANDGIHIGNLG